MQVPRPRDLVLLGYLPAMALIAWVLPEGWWPAMCAAAARLSGVIGGRRRAAARRIAHLLAGRSAPADAVRIAAALAANHHHARLQMLRCYRLGSWRPRVSVIGSEHVRDALRGGRGGVLWVAPFVFSDLVTKMALHQAGFPVTHLSRPEHGLSRSRFGMRFLNPIWTAVERRYLADRLVMTAEQSAGALRELIRRVQHNQLISITVGPLGRRRRAAPFLAGTLRVADGAPALALRTGAALLPVFTVRMPDGTFVTTIEAPPRLAPQLDAEEAMDRLVGYCAGLLESYALRWPEQYTGWELASTDDGGGSV